MTVEQLNESLFAKYNAALATKDYEQHPDQNNYSVNALYVWADGSWEERCDNEYGSSFGGMLVGTFSLSDEEKAALEDISWGHTVIDFKWKV